MSPPCVRFLPTIITFEPQFSEYCWDAGTVIDMEFCAIEPPADAGYTAYSGLPSTLLPEKEPVALPSPEMSMYSEAAGVWADITFILSPLLHCIPCPVSAALVPLETIVAFTICPFAPPT